MSERSSSEQGGTARLIAAPAPAPFAQRLQQSEKAKQERSARKRERRDLRRAGDGEDTAETPPPRSQDEVLAELAALHDEHESGRLSFDDFEVAKADLLAQLQV